jgi:hypothetical protein
MQQPVPKSSAKFVLVAMADCVNADGAGMVCWPSYRHLTERTGQDVKTVEAGLRRLREHGFIVDTGERRGVTGQVIVYRLNTPECGVVPASAFSLGVGPIGETNTPNLGGVDTAGKTPVFPSKTPVFPVQDPQISHETPPKTGDGTSNGTSNGTKKEPVRKARVRADDLPIPGVPDDLQADWVKVRANKRAGPITATVIAGLQREAAKAGLTVIEAVTFCCEAGWQGFNAGWYADRTKGRTPAAPSGKHSGFADKNYREGIEADGSFH